MKILVLGSGGREHALVWKLNQSPLAEKIFCIPGNAGIEQIAETASLPLSDFQNILRFIEEKEIDFTVVGPEQPLVEGITDFLAERGKLVFGPGKNAAQMEGSKIFSKNLMKTYNIPTAKYGAFSDFNEALRYLNSLDDGKIVVKADGLAAGKGSIVCENLSEAAKSIESMMVDNQFRDAGKRVVIEEFMRGQEASLFVITDSENYVTLSPAQDFKRAYDGDRGRNTGGMGSYAPTPVLTRTIFNRATREIVEPTLEGLKNEGIDYRGVLYVGLMVTNTGPKVVEFNCRFGDPETQVVLPLLENDLVELLVTAAKNQLTNYKVSLKDEYAVCVVAASGGYPGKYEKGKVISGLNDIETGVNVFHAGTRKENHAILTNGGRVLAVSATGGTLKGAVDKAYQNIEKIHFEGMHYRKDIAEKAWKIMT